MIKYLGVIPARGGSKGIPRKNIRPIAGKPLIAWSIAAARQSKLLDDFIVSTEDPEIAHVARQWGARVLLRPKKLATDTATTISVLQHILKELPAENIVLLQPTSPVRETGLVDRCIKRFEKSKVDNLGTGFTCKFMEYGSYTARRQELNGFFYDNGNIYVVKSSLIEKGKMFGRKVERLEISKDQGIEIDDELDFFLNERLLERASSAAPKLEIPGREIGGGRPVFIIAEAGVNHNGDVRLAKRLVDAAKAAGADAVKFQTFKSELLACAAAPKAEYQKAFGGKGTQVDMLKKLELSEAEFSELFEYCRKQGILFLSTPFEVDSARFLNRLGVAAFKVSSGELTNGPLVRLIASFGKPMILSTGMATMEEVERAVVNVGKTPFALLHCTSNYPARLEDVNLRAMGALRERFCVPAGYSDHTSGFEVPLAAVALGAAIIEKHITLDVNLQGPDHRASMPIDQFSALVESIRALESALGDGRKIPAKSEEAIRNVARKSVVASQDIPEGAVLTEEMLALKRPGTGIEPGELGRLVGKRLRRPISKDTLLDWSMIA